jgi:hypothetical protein
MVAEDRIMPVGAVQRWGRLLAAEAGNDRQLRVMVTGTDADTAVRLRY